MYKYRSIEINFTMTDIHVLLQNCSAVRIIYIIIIFLILFLNLVHFKTAWMHFFNIS